MLIYKVTNTANNKCYIGQTIRTLKKRKQEHINNTTNKSTIHYALHKYNICNFTWEVLCVCRTKKELDEMEFHYIKQYNSHVSENGYNLTYGGDGGDTFSYLTDDAKRLCSKKRSNTISELQKGIPRTAKAKKHYLKLKNIYGITRFIEVSK